MPKLVIFGLIMFVAAIVWAIIPGASFGMALLAVLVLIPGE